MSALVQKIVGLHRSINRFGKQQRWPILSVAFVILLAGTGWSIHSMQISWQAVDWRPLVALVGLAIPLAILFHGLEFQLCAMAVRRTITLRRAIGVTSLGTVANLLPLPASVALRAKALSDAGASLKDVGAILGLAAGLWAFLALMVTALSLPASALTIGLLGMGGVGTAVCAGILCGRSGSALTLGLITIRVAMIGVFIGRILLCFSIFDLEAGLADASVLSGAGILGNAAAIVPAGLGISELAGAALATLRDGSAAAAFLALTLNRVLGLAIHGVAVLLALTGSAEGASAPVKVKRAT